MVVKMTIMNDDVTGLLQRHHPLNIPRLVKKMKGFPWKAKPFQILQHIKNSRGGFINTNYPPPLCKGGNMTLSVRERVKVLKKKKKTKFHQVIFKKPILKKIQPQRVASGGILSPHL